MENVLNYRFRRRSKNYYDWMLNIIKSEKYHQTEAMIADNSTRQYFKVG
ncbi:hypothetical protein [Mangrovimonas aestuarii]|nr:hypothetical protein [Mangrovimonas aestuarii]